MKLAPLLSMPLICGASVSADFATLSPGKRLALRHTAADNITTRAKGGRMGIETLASLAAADLEKCTSVLAVDLFFWDSALPDPTPSLRALNGLLARARERGIPLVLGDVPALLPQWQPARPALNEGIARATKEYKLCRVMPFDAMFNELRRTGALEIRGKRRSWRELAPDGLHIGAEAAEFLADQMAELLGGS